MRGAGRKRRTYWLASPLAALGPVEPRIARGRNGDIVREFASGERPTLFFPALNIGDLASVMSVPAPNVESVGSVPNDISACRRFDVGDA